jgi:peptidoglycan/LPS O-acetylase OafA/YrhL
MQPPDSSERLASLDALRGLAALAVVVFHAVPASGAALELLTEGYLRWGEWGVVTFFLSSGFMIPASLERLGSLGRFWTRRVLRMMPLYWLTIACALACYAVGLVTPATNYPLSNPLDTLRSQPARTILSNLAMVQGWVGVQHLIGVYWTLTLELLFYLLVSLIFVCRLNRYAVIFALSFLVMGRLVDVLAPGGGENVSLIGVMFCGTVLAQSLDGRIARQTALGVAFLALVLFAPPSTLADWSGHLPHLSARITAFAAFGLAVHWRNRSVPHRLTWLGQVSYSLYLVHPLVIWVVPHTPVPILTLVAWTMTTIALSAVTYRSVEAPAIALGRRLTVRRPQPRHALAAVAD